jgi:hypothetical protein
MAVARTGSPNAASEGGDLDRDPDAPAVLARDFKLDQEGQGLQGHLAPRRLVHQAVEVVANGGQLQPGQPASERRGSRTSARTDRDGSGIDRQEQRALPRFIAT